MGGANPFDAGLRIAFRASAFDVHRNSGQPIAVNQVLINPLILLAEITMGRLTGTPGEDDLAATLERFSKDPGLTAVRTLPF